MIKMKDIAERADVSISTVSHVIRKTRRVNPNTEKKVLKAAQELGYHSSQIERDGNKKGGDVLGLVVSDIQNPSFNDAIEGFYDQAIIHDVMPFILSTKYDPARLMKGVKQLIKKGVPGIVVLSSELHNGIIDYVADHGVCAVYMDGERIEPLIGSLRVDYRNGIKEAVAYLKELGHQIMGFIGGSARLEGFNIRRQSFIDNVDPEFLDLRIVVETEPTVQGGYYACSKIFARSSPTAIVCANDLMAIGVLDYAHDHGIQVPRQLSVIGHDNIHFTKFTEPQLTTIDEPAYESGRLAFNMLQDLMADRSTGVEITQTPHLLIRHSTAPAPASGRLAENKKAKSAR
jgi:LacI family transcriptional regulator